MALPVTTIDDERGAPCPPSTSLASRSRLGSSWSSLARSAMPNWSTRRNALRAPTTEKHGSSLWRSATREAILRALEDPPAGLEELRAVQLQEHVGRVRDGLV